MEQHLAVASESLLDTLSFSGVEGGASYIQSRRQVRYYCTASNVFSPTQGTKVMTFSITDSAGYLDPQSVVLSFKVNNTSANDLYFCSANPSCLFQRLRIISNGVVIENIQDWGRFCHMMEVLTVDAFKKRNVSAMGLGGQTHWWRSATDEVRDGLESEVAPYIPANSSRIVVMPLLCGLFGSNKHYLPLKFMGNLQVELELQPSLEEILVTRINTTGPAGEGGAPSPSGPPLGVNVFDQALPAYQPDATANDFTLAEAVILADVIIPSSSLDNKITELVLKGGQIDIPFTSWSNLVQSVTQADISITLSRSFSRIETVYLSFYKKPLIYTLNGLTSATNGTQLSINYTPTTTRASWLPLTVSTHFYFPQFLYLWGGHFGDLSFVNPTKNNFRDTQGYTYQPQIEPEYELTLGSKKYPETQIRSSTQAFYYTQKALNDQGVLNNGSLNIDYRQYRTHKHIVAFQLNKENNLPFSGESSKQGDLLSLNVRGFEHRTRNADGTVNPPIAGTAPTAAYITIQYTSILSLSEAGVRVLD